jgi:hypothetical protein
MKKLIIFVILALPCLMYANKGELCSGEAVIESVSQKTWWLEDDPSTRRRGDYVMAIRIVKPKEYEGRRTLRVVKKEDLIIDGKLLDAVDRFTFEARDAFFQKKMFAPGFYDLKNIKLVSESKKPLPKPSVRGVPQSKKGLFDDLNISYLVNFYKKMNNNWVFSVEMRTLGAETYYIDAAKAAGMWRCWFVDTQGMLIESGGIRISEQKHVSLGAEHPLTLEINILEKYPSLREKLKNSSCVVFWYYTPLLSIDKSGRNIIVVNPIGGMFRIGEQERLF